MRPGEAALVAAVLGTGAAQDELVPALMHVYAGADNVVGLDVDRDRFDKFHFRSMIDGLLEALWKDEGVHTFPTPPTDLPAPCPCCSLLGSDLMWHVLQLDCETHVPSGASGAASDLKDA